MYESTQKLITKHKSFHICRQISTHNLPWRAMRGNFQRTKRSKRKRILSSNSQKCACLDDSKYCTNKMIYRLFNAHIIFQTFSTYFSLRCCFFFFCFCFHSNVSYFSFVQVASLIHFARLLFAFQIFRIFSRQEKNVFVLASACATSGKQFSGRKKFTR